MPRDCSGPTAPRPSDVVKTTVFVTDPGQFAAVNEAYVAFFGDHRPARSVVAVAALPDGRRRRGRGVGLPADPDRRVTGR